MKGVDLFLVMELLGHKSLDMTMRYAHITSERKQVAVKLLDGHFLDTGGCAAPLADEGGQAQDSENKELLSLRAVSSVG